MNSHLLSKLADACQASALVCLAFEHPFNVVPVETSGYDFPFNRSTVCSLPFPMTCRTEKIIVSYSVSNSVFQRLILQHVANTPFFPRIGCVCECLSLKNTKGICNVLHSGWGERKNSKGKEGLSCGCLSYLKHIYFCSWVPIIQHVITKYLQHTKHSCGTVNTKEEKKPLL